jgi:hypothetical protein
LGVLLNVELRRMRVTSDNNDQIEVLEESVKYFHIVVPSICLGYVNLSDAASRSL